MLIILGALIGFIASFVSTLLGGGAGLIATPAFFYIILHTYGADFAMQIALATCCGMSVCLSLVATYKHLRRGNIQIGELKYYLIALAIGSVVGGVLVKHIDTALLKHIFSVILILSGIWMILHNDSKIVKLPGTVAYPVCGLCGVLSVLATSTTFATMFFIKIGVEIRKAISIASVCVVINSTIATFMLVYGIKVNIPQTFGYISLPLLLSSAPFSIIGSLLAVRYLGVISPVLLKRLFIVLMFVSAVIMAL
ncbi:sulfite exporter TauE/SafE family protein [Francisella sp. Scap27]|uniref:sulfite exporter TauE/SafE family protein n=1 Tax=Francisella sp. Scap27 TaxID=2589986 RepID=UPI0015B85F19|nr:sulfite exporter TauE/SafE family protein [Francisella sp. Scap27]QLE79979.1 sulfite exporter TauE/SafE family protein [Francisella sp. Scap27]